MKKKKGKKESNFEKENKILPLSELIDKLMTIYGIDKKMKQLDVIKGWEEMMGKAVAYRTEQLKIKNRTLYIKLNSSVLREELSHGKEIIIMRVNQFAKESIIDDVWFE